MAPARHLRLLVLMLHGVSRNAAVALTLCSAVMCVCVYCHHCVEVYSVYASAPLRGTPDRLLTELLSFWECSGCQSLPGCSTGPARCTRSCTSAHGPASMLQSTYHLPACACCIAICLLLAGPVLLGRPGSQPRATAGAACRRGGAGATRCSSPSGAAAAAAAAEPVAPCGPAINSGRRQVWGPTGGATAAGGGSAWLHQATHTAADAASTAPVASRNGVKHCTHAWQRC